MRAFVVRARESFWFLPTVFGISVIVIAEGLVTLDHGLIDEDVRIAWLDSLSPSAARSILSIIGTSMLTVAGTSFSITISVLATTSSTYGPRLVRNFLADRANQVVLAVFTSTFLYALVVLRAVRSGRDDGGSDFVPTISVHLAVIVGVVDVAVLVFFIHHIADSVQITTLQRRVYNDLVRARDYIYPAESTNTTRNALTPLLGASPVGVETDGYVAHLDLERLRHIAEEESCVIDVLAMPGTYLVSGDPLVRVVPSHKAAGLARSVRAAFNLGIARTPQQDIRFALQQLVEIAVRGLASGTNDPYTAVSALDLAASALVPLCSRFPIVTGVTDDSGTVLVMVHWPDPDDLIREVFAGVSSYGLDHPLVVEAARHLALRLLSVAQPATAAVIREASAQWD